MKHIAKANTDELNEWVNITYADALIQGTKGHWMVWTWKWCDLYAIAVKTCIAKQMQLSLVISELPRFTQPNIGIKRAT